MAGYTRVQRKDKGFDFFDNRGRKVNVDQYVQATGSNKNQIIKDMAAAGDRVSQSFMRLPEQKRKSLFAQDAELYRQKKNSELNFANFVGEVSKNTADLSRTLASGIQQGAGVVGDVATQGGALVGRFGVQTNPFINDLQRQKKLQDYDRRLVNDNSVTNQIRNAIQSQTDLTGNRIVGTSDVDENATRIANGRGDFRDYSAVFGKGLDAATTATMFATPTALAWGAIGNTARQALNFAGKDALAYAGMDGTAGFANTYGQTGDFGESLKQGLTRAAISGVTQGTLDGIGMALRKTPQATRGVVQAVNDARPSQIAKSDPRVLGFDDQYAQLAQQFDSLPAGSPQRAQVSQAMAQNRQERLGVLRGVQREIGQGGYAMVPGKRGFDIDDAPDSIQRDDLIQQEANRVANTQQYLDEVVDNIWANNKKGSGVEVGQFDAEIPGVGSDTYTARRVSNNSPFYRAFFEEYGYKPTKKEVADLVKRYLDGEDNIARLEVAPEQRGAFDLNRERDNLLNFKQSSASSSASQTPSPKLDQSPRIEVPLKASKKSSRNQIVEEGIPTQDLNQSAVRNTSSPDHQPDNNIPETPRTYSDDTPDLDTKQYVKEMSKSQKEAMKGDSKIKTAASDFVATMVDDLAPIEARLNKAIKEGSDIDPKDHITYQLDRSRRSEGITHAYVKDKGLDKIIQDVPNTKEFDQYLIARHAAELDESVRTGRNKTADAALVKQLDAKYGKYAEQLYAYNRQLLDTAAEYGLINKRTAAALKKQYPDYVPFNRIFKEDELVKLHNNSKADASISKQSAVQKLKGSDRAIASPLNSIIDKTRVVIEQGERNRAAKILADYKDLPGNPFKLKELSPSETIGNRSTISYLDNGKKRTFETDPEIAEAAKHMSREQIGLLGRIVAIPARVLRAGATGLNVGFAGANVVKDVVGAMINSKHGMRVADPRSLGKALAAALHHNGKYYQELMREGVAGTSFDLYRNPLKSSVGEIRSQKNIGTRAIHNLLPQHWYRTLENTISRSEDFGRALQYYSNKAGYEKKFGEGSEKARILAGDQARNNSTNFFRSGSAGKHANLAIPYLNAGIQGARIQIRRIKERPAATLGKMAAVIAAPSALIAINNYANEKNREIMNQIPDYEKKGNIIILGANPTYNEKTREWDDVYKIPVPPQHTGIHNAIQQAVAANYNNEDYDLVGVLGGISENYTTIDPTDPRALANKLTPQGVKLAAEPMTNTNFFTGNKIVPDSQKNLPSADQVGMGTSGTAKVIGAATNTSPRVLDNMFRTSTGGAGQNLLNASDKTLAAVGAIKEDEVRGEDPLASITGRFYGADRISPSDKAEKQFESLKKEVTNSQAYKDASTYDRSRMLNRLQTDLDAVAWDADGNSEKKLTKKQQQLRDGGFDLSTYTNLDGETKTTAKKETTKDSSKKTATTKTSKRKSTKAKGGGRKRSYADEIANLTNINKLGTKTASSLLDLLAKTTVKSTSSKPTPQKVALKKIQGA